MGGFPDGFDMAGGFRGADRTLFLIVRSVVDAVGNSISMDLTMVRVKVWIPDPVAGTLGGGLTCSSGA